MRLSLLLILCFSIVLLCGCAKPDPEAELHWAARTGKLEKIEELLEQGFDIDKVIDGETPAHQAARRNDSKSLALLLQKGANPKIKDGKDRDLWQIVVREDAPFMSVYEARCLAVLLDYGYEGRINLIEAAHKADCKELIEKLVAQGADLEAGDEYGWTALHHAAQRAHEDACLALLEAGANPNAESTKLKNKFISRGESQYEDYRYEPGTRPADVADVTGGRGHKSCSQLVKEHGGTPNDKINNKKKY